MTDELNNIQQNNLQQPHRPIRRDAQRYDVLREAETQAAVAIAATAAPKDLEIFKVIITATIQEGESMGDGQKEKQFLFELIFKPNGNGLKLRLEETQLLLAHFGEILKEVEEEEKILNDIK